MTTGQIASQLANHADCQPENYVIAPNIVGKTYSFAHIGVWVMVNQVGGWGELWVIKSLGYERIQLYSRSRSVSRLRSGNIHQDGTGVYQPACRYMLVYDSGVQR